MEKVRFFEDEHRYVLVDNNGCESDLVSVTTLLKKHGLSPDYSSVNPNVLAAKAGRGKIIHKELEEYINHKQIGFTNELEGFIQLCEKENILPSKSEFMVWNDEIAGTVDVAGVINGCTFIGDFKTTSAIYRESVAWQLSLYAYLMKTDFDRYLCFHFDAEGNCKLIDLKPIPTSEIKKLLTCERNCEIYHKPNLQLDVDQCEKLLAIQNELKSLKAKKEFLEEQEAEFKKFLTAKMEETGIKQIDNDYFKITYVEPGTRETIDSKRLKKEMPEIAAQFLTSTEVKASVGITLKEV